MADVKEKHPSWFKMKLERRELVRQLSPEAAVNVLLACWDYLETGEKPLGLSPIENVAFSSFMPDMDEAWSRYIQRITAKSNRTTSTDIDRPHLWRRIAASGEAEISKRDLFRLVRGKFKKAESMEAPLRVLAEYSYIRIEDVERDGAGRKASPKIKVNPLTYGHNGQNGHN